MKPSVIRYREICKIGEHEAANVNNNGKRSLNAMSCGEVAKALGITRQAVHQGERVALNKLRIGLLAAVRETNPQMAAWIERRAT